MFTGFTDDTVHFFLDLKFHNDSGFFHSNHDRYVQVVQTPFYAFINDLAVDMLQIDPAMEVRPHKCLSRIHRDTRFSRDKSPYRDHHWILFRRQGEPREKSLFYFFEFGPDRLDWGLGIWGENRELMDLFRKRMRADSWGVAEMMEGLKLAGRNLGVGGTVFKRMTYPPDLHESLKRWYAAKELYIGKIHPDYSLAFSERLIGEVRNDYLTLAPLYRLLRGCADEQRDDDQKGW